MRITSIRWGMIAVLATLALTLALPAHAANKACFDWVCDTDTHYCQFDASCTQLDDLLWRYRWTFGDGSGYTLTGSSAIDHQYASNVYHTDVQLLVIPYSVDSFSVTCTVTVEPLYGPPQPTTSGRCE